MFNFKINNQSINIVIAVVLSMFVFANFKCATVECPIPGDVAPVLKSPVKIVGTTQNGKYNVYDLKGELYDQTYMTSGGVAYTRNDLPTRLQVVSYDDLDSGDYVCGFVCKNKQGQIVGINPSWARTYGAKPPYDY